MFFEQVTPKSAEKAKGGRKKSEISCEASDFDRHMNTRGEKRTRKREREKSMYKVRYEKKEGEKECN